jgi:hypothetical protein
LFKPIEDGYKFKVIVTNKHGSTSRVVAFHDGRGSQEGGIFGELNHRSRKTLGFKTPAQLMHDRLAAQGA